MTEYCEFEIDFGQFDELSAVVVHDECGEHKDEWFYRCDDLASDNAKLRELLRAAWRCIRTGANCFECRRIAGGCTLQSAMCDLGIEATS